MKIFMMSLMVLLMTACGSMKDSKPSAASSAELQSEAQTVAFEGHCPMGLCLKKKKMGTADHQATIEGKTYNFSSAEAKANFMKDPQTNMNKANQTWAIYNGERAK